MLRFYSVDLGLVSLVLSVHIPISFFQFLSVVLGGVFWLSGLVPFCLFWWLIFARDWNLHILNRFIVYEVVSCLTVFVLQFVGVVIICPCYALSCLVHGVFVSCFFSLYCMGIVMGCGFWWGVSFFCLCTTTFVCISCCPSNMCSCIFFLLLVMFCVPISYSHLPLVFLLPICVCFVHAWMKTFGGVCICILSYASICGF